MSSVRAWGRVALLSSLFGSTFAFVGCGGGEPRSRTENFCQLPANANHEDTQEAYEHWKTTLLTADGAGGFLRVRRPNSAGAIVNSTVSEGIAYGMLLSVYMDDQPTFDALWQYSQLHVNENGLMNWYIGPDGATEGSGGATDSDEDIAFALVQAHVKWGGQGSLAASYEELARAQIDRVWQFEVDHAAGEVLLSGDTWGANSVRNPSYFAPAFYRTFAEFTGNQGWLDVVRSSYDIIERSLNAASGNAENGLVPAWCNDQGVPVETNGVLHFQFDSCRTPFRIGQDYCWHGEPRAKAYLEKITSFYEGVGLANIIDGYDLNGTPHPQFSVDGSRAAAFVGPAAVGAMFDASHADFASGAYTDLITPNALIVGDSAHDNAGSIYYNTSWRVLSLLMLDGTYQDLSQAP
ncbi:MAG TPA: glycosyl hydrolase family 8 [Polyangiaceae bacterium]|nr:glycosyl hydrolase family 8 [Polyangiaceae bacterium]